MRGDTAQRLNARAPSADDVTVVAAMRVESRAVARHASQLALLEVGIGGHRWDGTLTTPVAVSAGVCGGLRRDLSPGTVIVAGAIAREDGVLHACDEELVQQLLDAADHLRLPHVRAPLVSSAHGLVLGPERDRWAERGFAGADMESGLLIGRVERMAAVRVILDTPLHEISPEWEHPARAARNPRLWREGMWLAWHTPRYAARAARVLAGALPANPA